MALFKKKIVFPTLCEYGFRTWEVGYVANKYELTSEAIESLGLSGLKPTAKQIDLLWMELEYLFMYQVMVYAYVYFAGKQTSEDISFVLSQKYFNFLLTDLRKELKPDAIKALEGFVDFSEEVAVILNKRDDSAPIVGDSLATYPVMVLNQHVETQIPKLKDVATYLVTNYAWASSKSLYNLGKIIWE